MWFKTTKVFLTAGVGVGRQALNAFDNALRDANIADFNLIRVTSIVPPGIPVHHISPSSEFIKGEGLLIPTIYEAISSKKVGREISAAVGIGITVPAEKGAGIIFTYSCFGSKKKAAETVREMVEEGMRAKGYLKHRCEIAAASAIVEKDWTCVIASAVFCDKHLERFFTSPPPKPKPSAKSAPKRQRSVTRKSSKKLTRRIL